MRKIVMLLLSAVLIFGSIPVFGEISERELRTLEGSYQFDVSFDDADLVNTMLKMNYKVSTPITGDLMAHSFVLDVKYKDGEMLLYDRGLLIDNSGMATNNEIFFFRFFYEVPDASIPGIGYLVEGSVAFDASFKSFDTISTKRVQLIYRDVKDVDQYGSLVSGDLAITKVGNAPEEETEAESEDSGTLPGKTMALTFVKGLVQVKRAGSDEFIRARRNMQVNPGDTVYTGKGSYADLGSMAGEFAISGHDISLNPLSVFTVPVEEKVVVPRKSRLRVLVEDAVENASNLFKDPEDMVIETPTAVAGIRGTDFWVIVDEAGNTEILLNEGSVYVESKVDGSNVLLSPGEKVSVSEEGPIGAIEAMDEADLKEFDPVDYESIPDYYEGLGEDEVVTDLENYVPGAENEETSEGGGSLIWLVIPVVILGAGLVLIKNKKKNK